MILIIDDEKNQILTIRKFLEKIGHEVLTVNTSEENLNILEVLKDNPVKLVLLDYHMPGKDGETILKEIRTYYSAIQLPVLMLTSETQTKFTVSCFKNGANDFLNKPIEFEVAKARIETQLKMIELEENLIKSEQLETVKALVVTYGHEINNPLTIAMLALSKKDDKLTAKDFEDTREALNRIGQIVSKIRQASEKEIEFENYASNSKMLKIS